MDKLFIFIFGSIVGSFLNVCIYRLPRGESVIRPRSHCPKCNRIILWYDNVPFLSYLILRGRCRYCQEKISPRYFLVEFITAAAFLLLYGHYGISFYFFLYTIFTCGLIIAAFVDIQHRIIPDEISLGGIVVGLILNLIKTYLPAASHSLLPIYDSLLGIFIGGGIIWLTGVLFDLVYFKLLKKGPIQGETESMGGGDVKLLAMIGAFLGWKATILTFFLAPVFGAVVGVINLIATKDHTIPYGPFLSLAAFISIFWFNQIISLILVR